MVRETSSRGHRPREPRRRVAAAARLRRERGWSDATIVNISSRGLQIQTSWPLEEGARVELRRGAEIIHAQIVWSEGVRVGLRSDERLPVDDIVAGEGACTAVRPAAGERRRQPRSHDSHRLRGRTIEFVSVVGLGTILAAGILADFQQAFAKPLALVALRLR